MYLYSTTNMSEMSQDVLKGCLIKMWKDAKSPKDMNTFFQRTGILMTKEGEGIPIGPDGYLAFKRMVLELHKDDNIQRNSSLRNTEREIQNFLFSIKDTDQREIETKATEAISLLLQKLRVQPRTWTNIVPIVNLDVQIDSLQVGKVMFKKFNEEDLTDLIQVVEEITGQTASPPDVQTETNNVYRQILRERFLNRTIAKVTVDAIDGQRSREISLELVDMAINVLRFYACGLFHPVFREQRPYIGIEGELIRSNYPMMTFMPNTEQALNLQTTGPLVPFTIDNGTVARMREYNFNILHRLLLNDQPTEFESKVLNAINFYGMGTNSEDDASAFINIMIALESLLLKGRGPSKGLLAERVAFLLGNNYKVKLSFFEKMQELYQIRSNIVHSGKRDFPISELYLLSRITFNCIVKLLRKTDSLTTISDFINWVQKEKFT